MTSLFQKLSFLIALGGVILSLGSSSFGQEYQPFNSELEYIRQTARWRLGPFRLAPLLQIRDIGYDDNVYGVREQDLPVSDYTATISPRFNVYLLFRNWLIFSFLENPEYVYYFKVKGERSFNNTYSPALKLLVFHRFVLSGNYHHRRARVRATSEFDVRADEENQGYGGSIFFETPRRTSLGLSAAVNRYRYEDDRLPGEVIYLSRALNREEKELTLEVYYRVFSRSYFFVNAGYTDYKFEFIESLWKDSYSYQVSSGIRFPLLGRARGIVSLGYKRFLPRHRELKSFSGLIGNTSLDLRINRFGFRLRYSRDSTFSYTVENIFFIENIYGAGASFYLTEFLRLDYNFTYGINRYPEKLLVFVPGVGFQEITREDRYHIHTAGFVFRVLRDIGVGLTANYWDRNSSDLFESGRRRWFFGGYLTYEF